MQGSAARSAGETTTGSVSGLPIPRFVSLKSDRVNARSGPNKDQEVRWVYTHVGMPVEINAEFENWRRIRDWEGAEGWVYHTLLSASAWPWWCPKRRKNWSLSTKTRTSNRQSRLSYNRACWAR